MSANFYSIPSNQVGGFIVYGNHRRQRGAGAFGSFRKFMAPIGRQALSGIKSIAKNKTVQNIAKKAAAKGAEVLTGVAVDALHGRNVHESLKERSRNAALEALTGESAQSNPPITKKRKRAGSSIKSTPSGKKRKRTKSLKQKKRKASLQALKAPVAKRRRRIKKTEDLF